MIDMRAYGFQEQTADMASSLCPARVIEIHRELYRIISQHGEADATLKGSFLYRAEDRSDYPAVGDFVLLDHNESGRSGIVRVLPRKSKFSRTDFSGHKVEYVKTVLEQVVAANFDYVFILSSLNKDFNVNRITRYLAQAKRSGGIPVVLLSKADLCENSEEHAALVREVAGNVDVIPISSHTGFGLNRLSRYLQPRNTIVFLGMSGVGKSSLLNALAGEEKMSVKEIREDDARGRHTTTDRQLIMLPSGAMIIDTPGMRELGLWQADEGIDAVFADVEELIQGCRFSDCRHKTEPGCAVLEALENGTLSALRWRNFLAQKQEAAFVGHSAKKSGKKA